VVQDDSERIRDDFVDFVLLYAWRHRNLLCLARAPDLYTRRDGRTKDDLENAMDDLNRTTNRLRRKFDPTSNYLETKAQMEQVMDSARRVNQAMSKGNYGSQAEKYWAALRANINDLTRCYNLTPIGA